MTLPSISDATNVRSIDDLKNLFGLVPITIDDLVVDLLSSYETNYAFDVTQRPVETGYISDARIAQPMTLHMECVLTNAIENMTPTGAIKSLISGTFSLDSHKEKADALLELKDKNKVIDVFTKTKKYTSMMISNLSFNKSDALDATFFSIDLVHVTIVKNKVSSVSSAEIPKKLESEVDSATSDRTAPKGSIGMNPAM